MGLHQVHSNLAAGSRDKISDQYPNCARINRSRFANKIVTLFTLNRMLQAKSYFSHQFFFQFPC